MSYDSDPPRLSELRADAPPELRKLFEHARRDVPNDAELGKLLTRLGPVIGVGGLAAGDALRVAGSQAAGSSSGTGLTLGKLLGGLFAVGVAAAGITWFTSAQDQDEPPRPAAKTAIVAPAPVKVEPPPAQPATEREPEVAEPPPSAVTPLAVPTQAAPAADSVSAEARLLERARAAVDTNPKQALALAREHTTRFPNGVLAQEREVIAIEALRKLGRAGEADARAGQFKKSYPGSAHQRAVGTASPP